VYKRQAPNPSTASQAVTLTATVVAVAPGSGTPTGTVTFFDGGSSIGTGTLNSSGQATLTTAALAVGSHSLTAQYGGDTNFLGSTAAAVSQTVKTAGKQATTTTLSSSLNPAPFGQPVTFTATISAPSGTPTGSVTFSDGGTALGTASLSGGTASFTTATLLGGSHSITAAYSGDSADQPSTSSPLVEVISFTTTVSGTKSGGFTVTNGQSLVITGTVNGPLTVQAGGSLFLQGATVTGPLRSTGAVAIAICGSSLNGPMRISGTTGFVRIGGGSDDPTASCAGSTITGSAVLDGNHGGIEIEGNTFGGPLTVDNSTGNGPTAEDTAPEIEANTIGGPLSCSGNTPAPTNDGHPNTVSGPEKGQCAGF